MINKEIRSEIVSRMNKIEVEHNVKILFSIESGSRAWGFESPNSDYDVRFVYVNKLDWYLSIDQEPKRDVIELPIIDDIDLNGWDLRKALKLYKKCNPTIYEWLNSSISYYDDGSFRSTLLKLSKDSYSRKSAILHYLNMAKNNFKTYIVGDLVPIKKYFYVLRPLFASMCVLETGSYPPIEFNLLRKYSKLSIELSNCIDGLLIKKKSVIEMSLEPSILILNNYIENCISEIECSIVNLQEILKLDTQTDLDNIFKRYLSN